jgi:peptide/nickel transport system ATP-binding protein
MYAGNVVESGPTEDVLAAPRHPYTQLLLAAAPDPRTPLEAEEDGGPAEPPRVIDPSPGCRFRDRCPVAVDVCGHVDPRPVELAPEHSAACHVAAADVPLPDPVREGAR